MAVGADPAHQIIEDRFASTAAAFPPLEIAEDPFSPEGQHHKTIHYLIEPQKSGVFGRAALGWIQNARHRHQPPQLLVAGSLAVQCHGFLKQRSEPPGAPGLVA
jgi:hypothetical protein